MTPLAKWRFGLRVAMLTGIAKAFACGLIVPEATWRQIALIVLINIGGSVEAYLSKHPSEEVES